MLNAPKIQICDTLGLIYSSILPLSLKSEIAEQVLADQVMSLATYSRVTKSK